MPGGWVDGCSRRLLRASTPAYFYHAPTLRAQFTRLARALPERFEILYAVKANPHAGLLRCLRRLGAGADVASAGELEAALAAGFAPGRMSFAGPGKTAAELALAARRGVRVQLESIEELVLADRAAARLRTPVHAGVRINPAAGPGSRGMSMGGGSKVFGIDEEELPRFFARLSAARFVRFGGVHVYTGSQVLDADAIADGFEDTLRLARLAQRAAGRALEVVNFGGGFGVPYFAGEKALDLARLARRLAAVFGSPETSREFPRARFWAESGRFLAAPAGVYVATVLYRKRSRGRTYLVLDGGMNHHLAASGNLGGILRKNYPVTLLGPASRRRIETVTIAGPLCTPLDTLAHDVRLPRAEPGDRVAFLQSGAYGLTASPCGFLSHPPARETLIEGPVR